MESNTQQYLSSTCMSMTLGSEMFLPKPITHPIIWLDDDTDKTDEYGSFAYP